MIRFSAFLVVVAVGLLVAGVVTSKLLLVYIAIGVSGVALLALGIGAAVNWRELTGKPGTDAAETSAQGPTPAPQAAAPQAPAPQVPAAPVPAGSGWPVGVSSGPSRAGYLPATEPPVRAQPAAAQAHVGVWGSGNATSGGSPESRPAAPAAPPPGDQPPADDKPSEPGQPGRDQAAAQEQTSTDRQGEAQPTAPAVADTPATPHAEQTAEAEQSEPAGLDPDLEVTVVPGVPRYHNARCILIRFMGDSDLDKMTLAAAREAGCTPCRACLPDQPEKSPELPDGSRAARAMRP